MELYQVTHSSPEIKTVKEYCTRIDSVAFSYNNRISEFLLIKGPDLLTNSDRILASYTTIEERLDNLADKQGELLLKVGVVFYIPKSDIERIGLLTDGIQVTSNNVVAFKAKKLADLEKDVRYRKNYSVIASENQGGSFSDEYPDATVWLWCRSLSDTFSQGDERSELKGEIFDITRFIQSLETTTGRNGGNFKVTLPPLVCELRTEVNSSGKESSKYVVRRKSISTYSTSENSNKGDSYVSQNSILENNKLNSFLFHTIIGENDLIFIRFETLELEKAQRMKDKDQFYIDKSNLAGRIYDMIGLVDTNNESIKFENNDVNITISGRDLTKLFIEDGTYFYALENSQGQLKLAGGSSSDNELIQRVFSDNSLYYLSLYFNTSIEYILKFIILQLSNIRVVPNDLFSSYGERVNKVANFIPVSIGVAFEGDEPVFNKKQDRISRRKAKGIWQIIKLVIDESVTSRRIIDSSMSSANGSLLNFIRKICQEPFVEFYSDTYGDEFYLIVRKPPHDKIGMTSLLKGNVSTESSTESASRGVVVDIELEDEISVDLSFDTNNTYSWYHFTPQNLFLGDPSTYSLVLTPAVYFKEYAEIWGSKPLDIVHNYAPYYSSSREEIGDMTYYQEQAVRDLKFLIESHAYLPFTRTGTLTVRGDRRFKIGNLVRRKSTGEIFKIDSVSQKMVVSDGQVDRVSTLGVSRGMIEDFIYGVDINGIGNVSYFNIINTELTFEKTQYKQNGKKYTALNTEKVFSKFMVNKDIFNFFLKKLQMIPTNYTKTS